MYIAIESNSWRLRVVLYNECAAARVACLEGSLDARNHHGKRRVARKKKGAAVAGANGTVEGR